MLGKGRQKREEGRRGGRGEIMAREGIKVEGERSGHALEGDSNSRVSFSQSLSKVAVIRSKGRTYSWRLPLPQHIPLIKPHISLILLLLLPPTITRHRSPSLSDACICDSPSPPTVFPCSQPRPFGSQLSTLQQALYARLLAGHSSLFGSDAQDSLSLPRFIRLEVDALCHCHWHLLALDPPPLAAVSRRSHSAHTPFQAHNAHESIPISRISPPPFPGPLFHTETALPAEPYPPSPSLTLRYPPRLSTLARPIVISHRFSPTQKPSNPAAFTPSMT